MHSAELLIYIRFSNTLFLFFIRILFFRPRLNIPIFLPILGWKYSCNSLNYSLWHCRLRMYYLFLNSFCQGVCKGVTFLDYLYLTRPLIKWPCSFNCVKRKKLSPNRFRLHTMKHINHSPFCLSPIKTNELRAILFGNCVFFVTLKVRNCSSCHLLLKLWNPNSFHSSV